MQNKNSLGEALRADMRALRVRRVSLWLSPLYLLINAGFLVAVLYRLSALFQTKGLLGKVVAKILWRVNVFCSGCYISPTAVIGYGLRMPHPVGIVIGDYVVLGRNATIYQNVTLGLRRAADELGLNQQYPRVDDNVTFYSGAVVMGSIRIGKNAIIGANAVVLRDVPDSATAIGVPARLLPSNPKQVVRSITATG